MSTLAIAIADIHGEIEVLEKILEEHPNEIGRAHV